VGRLWILPPLILLAELARESDGGEIGSRRSRMMLRSRRRAGLLCIAEMVSDLPDAPEIALGNASRHGAGQHFLRPARRSF
jgi:hypothetical protein